MSNELTYDNVYITYDKLRFADKISMFYWGYHKQTFHSIFKTYHPRSTNLFTLK